MPKPAPKKTRINLNLLYPQGSSQKLPIKFLKWLISYGRYIVVVVEIVVLVCFAMRFKLDSELADLKEKIDSNVPYLESKSLDEALIVQTQTRILNIQKTYLSSEVWAKTLTLISAQIPLGTKLTSLNLEKPAPLATHALFKLTAVTSSNNEMAYFINDLKKDKNLIDVDLTSVAFESGNITFTITGSTKPL